jgi:uncharacterized membrane protein
MDWFSFAILGYFFLSLEVVLDKFLLSSKRVSHPVIYSFYAGTLGLFALVFCFSENFHFLDSSGIVSRFIGGIIFAYAMLSLFFALNKSEASRVTPVTGAVIAIVAFLLSMVFMNERLAQKEIFGLTLLICGGLWISYDFSRDRKQRLFDGFYVSILAGFLLGVSLTLNKHFYIEDNFINSYIWTRIGAFLGALSFFIVPSWRKLLVNSLSGAKKSRKKNKHSSGLLFVVTRSFGGVGSFLKEFATSFGVASVAIVNALVSVEYVLVYVLGIIFSLWIKNVFNEKRDWKSVVQKIIAIMIISIGVALVKHK